MKEKSEFKLSEHYGLAFLVRSEYFKTHQFFAKLYSIQIALTPILCVYCKSFVSVRPELIHIQKSWQHFPCVLKIMAKLTLSLWRASSKARGKKRQHFL
jgi:hypothetical protein